jgi:hypothetical protein
MTRANLSRTAQAALQRAYRPLSVHEMTDELESVAHQLLSTLPEGEGIKGSIDFFVDGWRFNAFREHESRVTLMARGVIPRTRGRGLPGRAPDFRHYRMSFGFEDPPSFQVETREHQSHAVVVFHAAFVSDAGIPIQDTWT